MHVDGDDQRGEGVSSDDSPVVHDVLGCDFTGHREGKSEMWINLHVLAIGITVLGLLLSDFKGEGVGPIY